MTAFRGQPHVLPCKQARAQAWPNASSDGQMIRETANVLQALEQVLVMSNKKMMLLLLTALLTNARSALILLHTACMLGSLLVCSPQHSAHDHMLQEEKACDYLKS